MNKKKAYIIGAIIIILAIIVAGGAMYYGANYQTIKLKQTGKWSNETPKTSVIVKDTKDGFVSAEVSDVTVAGRDSLMTINLDNLDKNVVTSFDIYNNVLCSSFITHDGFGYNYLIVTNNPVILGNFEKEDIEQAFNTENFLKTIEASEDEDINSSETIRSADKQGIVYVIDSAMSNKSQDDNIPDIKVDSEALVNNVYNNIKYSNTENYSVSDIDIEIENIGKLNINNLDGLKDKGGVLYNGNQGIFSVYNWADDQQVLFLTSIDNPYLVCEKDKLIQYKDYNNVFIPEGYNDPESLAFNSFAIQADGSAYYIKVHDLMGLDYIDKVLDWFGVKSTDKKIESVLEAKLTWEEYQDGKRIEEVEETESIDLKETYGNELNNFAIERDNELKNIQT